MRARAFIVLLLYACTAYSQTRGYAGYLRIGTMNMPDAGSKLGLVVPGINNFKNSFYGIGGELEYKARRTILDADIMILSHGVVSSDTHYAEPFTGSLIAKAGYVVFESKTLLLYPFAGGGISSTLLNKYVKSNGTKEQMHTIYIIQPVADIGLSTDVILYRFKNSMPTGTLPVGLRAGYRFATTSDHWKKIKGTDMQRTAFSASGWYISIALGMGYISPIKAK